MNNEPIIEIEIAGKPAVLINAEVSCRINYPTTASIVVSSMAFPKKIERDTDVSISCGGNAFAMKVLEVEDRGSGRLEIQTADRLLSDIPQSLIGLGNKGGISCSSFAGCIDENIELESGVQELLSKAFLAGGGSLYGLLDALAHQLGAVWFRRGKTICLATGKPGIPTQSQLLQILDDAYGFCLKPLQQSFPGLGQTVIVDESPMLVSAIKIRAQGGHPVVRIFAEAYPQRPSKNVVSTDWVVGSVIDSEELIVEIQQLDGPPLRIPCALLQMDLSLASLHVPIRNGDRVLVKVPTSGVIFGLPLVLPLSVAPPSETLRLVAEHYELALKERHEVISGNATSVSDGRHTTKGKGGVEIHTGSTVDVRRQN